MDNHYLVFGTILAVSAAIAGMLGWQIIFGFVLGVMAAIAAAAFAGGDYY